jgi:hypothetical protein
MLPRICDPPASASQVELFILLFSGTGVWTQGLNLLGRHSFTQTTPIALFKSFSYFPIGSHIFCPGWSWTTIILHLLSSCDFRHKSLCPAWGEFLKANGGWRCSSMVEYKDLGSIPNSTPSQGSHNIHCSITWFFTQSTLKSSTFF